MARGKGNGPGRPPIPHQYVIPAALDEALKGHKVEAAELIPGTIHHDCTPARHPIFGLVYVCKKETRKW